MFASFLIFSILISLVIIFSTHISIIEVGNKNPGPFQIFITDFYALFAMLGLTAYPISELHSEDAGMAFVVACAILVVCWLIAIWLLSRARIQEVKLRWYGQIWLPMQAALVAPMQVVAVVLLDDGQKLAAALGFVMILISVLGAYFAMKKVARRSPNNHIETPHA